MSDSLRDILYQIGQTFYKFSVVADAPPLADEIDWARGYFRGDANRYAVYVHATGACYQVERDEFEQWMKVPQEHVTMLKIDGGVK